MAKKRTASETQGFLRKQYISGGDLDIFGKSNCKRIELSRIVLKGFKVYPYGEKRKNEIYKFNIITTKKIKKIATTI